MSLCIRKTFLQYGGLGRKLWIVAEGGLVYGYIIYIIDAVADDASLRRVGRQIDGTLIARGLHQCRQFSHHMTTQGRVGFLEDG